MKIDGHQDHDGHDFGENDQNEFVVNSNASHDNAPWLEIILSTFVINLVSFSGIAIVAFTLCIPRLRKRFLEKRKENQEEEPVIEDIVNDNNMQSNQISSSKAGVWIENVILPSFAAGALLATCVFLLIPEGIEMLNTPGGHADAYKTGATSGHEGRDYNHSLQWLPEYDRYSDEEFPCQRDLRWLQQNNGAQNHSSHEDQSGHDDQDDHADQDNLEDHDDHAGHDNHAGYDSHGHGQGTWKFGACLLGGFLVPLFMQSVFPGPHQTEERCQVSADDEEKSASNANKIDVEDVRAIADSTMNSTTHSIDSEMESTGLARCRYFLASQHGEEKSQQQETTLVGGDGPGRDNVVTLDNTNDEKAPEISSNEIITSAANIEEQVGGEEAIAQGGEEANIDKMSAAGEQKVINWSLAFTILLGDFFHNFTDGIFVGNAFVFCTREVAFAIVAATIYEEFAQELADFSLLTVRCGFKVRHALLLNFVSGFSVMIGAIVIVAASVPVQSTGAILSFSAGVYINIASTECITKVQQFGSLDTVNRQTKLEKALPYLVAILCFMVGAVPIGLVLLNHSNGCS